MDHLRIKNSYPRHIAVTKIEDYSLLSTAFELDYKEPEYTISLDNIFNSINNCFIPYDPTTHSYGGGYGDTLKKDIFTFVKGKSPRNSYSIYNFILTNSTPKITNPTIYYQVKNNLNLIEEYDKVNTLIFNSTISIPFLSEEEKKSMCYILVPSTSNFSNGINLPKYYKLELHTGKDHFIIYINSYMKHVLISDYAKGKVIFQGHNPSKFEIQNALESCNFTEDPIFKISTITTTDYSTRSSYIIENFIDKQANKAKKGTVTIPFTKVDLVEELAAVTMITFINNHTISSSTAFHRMLNTLGPEYKVTNFTSLSSGEKTNSVMKRLFKLYNECEKEIIDNLNSIGLTAKVLKESNGFQRDQYDLMVQARRATTEIACIPKPGSSSTRLEAKLIRTDGTSIVDANNKIADTRCLVSAYAIFDKVLLSLPINAIDPKDKDSSYAEFVKKLLTLHMYAAYIIENTEISSNVKSYTGTNYTTHKHIFVNTILYSKEELGTQPYSFNIPKNIATKIIQRITADVADSFMFSTEDRKKRTKKLVTPSSLPENDTIEVDSSDANVSNLPGATDADLKLITDFVNRLKDIDPKTLDEV